MDTLNKRRRDAERELGYSGTKVQSQMQKAMHKEEKRRGVKLRRKQEIEESSSYRAVKGISTMMDKYFLDPIVGLIPGVGDAITSVFVLPFIYVSAVHIRSLPLTLAVIFNVLKDVALGLIPFWIGNIADIFNRSFLQNFKLINGFVEDDREVIEKVNKNAIWMTILIIIFGFIIYWLVSLTIGIFNVGADAFNWIVDWIKTI